MKSFRFLVWMALFLVGVSAPGYAQVAKGNPLRNIPVTDLTGTVSNARISIDDFFVEDDQVYVTSTLTGTVGGQHISQTVSYPLGIVASTCDVLILSPGVVMESDYFQIANFSVNITSTQSTDSRLRAALCSIADLHDSNASAYMLVAKIKQAARALIGH